MTPRRVQRSRQKGAVNPPAVYVGRPGKWGNPHRPPAQVGAPEVRKRTAAECVARYRADLLGGRLAVSIEDVRRELAGRDLACWCPLDQPCHADVLLELANAGGEPVAGEDLALPVSDVGHGASGART